MIKSIAFGFALTLATSVQAKSPAALHHQPDGMITQIPEACGAGRVRIDWHLRHKNHQAPSS